VDRAAVHRVDDAGLTTDAGHDAAIGNERHEVAGTGLGAEQVVIPADILLGERGVETLGRIFDVIDTVPGQAIADEGLVEFLTVATSAESSGF
jgi:hypothetical protein